MSFVRCLIASALTLSAVTASAQERAYFVTYDHYLEEPRNLEIAIASTTGIPKNGHAAYSAPWLELEYGDAGRARDRDFEIDRKSTRLNSSHVRISYAVFCLYKKKVSMSIDH